MQTLSFNKKPTFLFPFNIKHYLLFYRSSNSGKGKKHAQLDANSNPQQTKKTQPKDLPTEPQTLSNSSQPSQPCSNASERSQISSSEKSRTSRTCSNASEPSRHLESSLSSSSDVSLPPGLNSGQSPGPSPDSSSPVSPNRSLGAIPKRRISPDASMTSRSSQRSSSSEASTTPSRWF